MDPDRTKKTQEQVDKMTNEGGGQKQHAAPRPGEEERRRQQTDYDGEDRRKQEFSYGSAGTER